MSTQDNRTQEKAKRRRLRAWNIVAPHLDRLLKSKLGFTHDDFEPADIDGPVIVAINHTCAYDPFLVAAAFKNKPLTFVASEHLMRIKYLGAFADRYASIIPHRKGDKAGRAATVSSQYGYCNVKVDYNKQTYFKVRAVNQKKINGKLYRAFGRMSAVKTTTVRKASTAVVKAQASAQGAVQDESLDISQAAAAPADQSDAAAVQITVPADDQAAEEAGVLISSPETDDQPAE